MSSSSSSLSGNGRNINKNKGSGYGGNASDEKQRNKGKKAALKRETKTWKDWQVELKTFLKQQQKQHDNNNNNNNNVGTNSLTNGNSNNNNNHVRRKKKDRDSLNNNCAVIVPYDNILNTLKKVIRSQANDWFWQQPQRQTYIYALEICMFLTKYSPKSWGNPDDEESVIAAFEQLTQTSKLLVKQQQQQLLSLGGRSGKRKETPVEVSNIDHDSMDTLQWFKNELSKCSTPDTSKDSNDNDLLLPTTIIKIRNDAMTIIQSISDVPECSMMDPHDYYRQKLRPLAFDMVSVATDDDDNDNGNGNGGFESPKHYFCPGGGYERTSQGRVAAGGGNNHKNKKKKKVSNPNNKSMKSSATILWKELSTYPTVLPIEYGSSIFVRASENELDKLRVLIIGPDDTPYANGFFFFDVTMGNDYPNNPPKVQFLTTGGGSVRFNPNLYACGKVCLSLLGTWAGPSWIKTESTLLQVLISIQSLILGTSNPYFNEPGWERSEGTPQGKVQSDKYNENIRKQTFRVAILPFLKSLLHQNGGGINGNNNKYDDVQVLSTNPATTTTSTNNKRKAPPPHSNLSSKNQFEEFHDIIENHFQLKESLLRKQLFQWLEKDKSLQDLYTEYWNVSDDIDEQRRSVAASTAIGGRRGKRDSNKQVKSMSAASPIKTNNDGVILLDDDDDDDDDDEVVDSNNNSRALLKTHGTNNYGNKKSGDGGEIIELLVDSDDDELMNRKPVAVPTVTNTSNKVSSEDEKVDEDEDEGDDGYDCAGGAGSDDNDNDNGNATNNPPTAHILVASSLENDDIVDLT